MQTCTRIYYTEQWPPSTIANTPYLQALGQSVSWYSQVLDQFVTEEVEGIV